MNSDVVGRFFERQSHYFERGARDRALYTRLATDPTLPPYVKEDDAAAIAGLSAAAMSQRRHRHMDPPFIRHSNRSVVYPLPLLCDWLGKMLEVRH